MPATNRFQKTQTVTGDTVTIGSSIRYTENNSSNILPVYHNRNTVNIEEIITPAGAGNTEAELKAPTVISISLQLSF